MVEIKMIDVIKTHFKINISKLEQISEYLFIGDDKYIFLMCLKDKVTNIVDFLEEIKNENIEKIFITGLDIIEKTEIYLQQNIPDIDEICFSCCTFKKDTQIYNPKNIKITFNNVAFQTLRIEDSFDFKGENVSIIFNDCKINNHLYINLNEVKNLQSDDLYIDANTYFKTNFMDNFSLLNAVFNGMVSFNGSRFIKIPDFSSTIFKDTKQVYFDYTSLEHISKATLEEQVSEGIRNNSDKKDYENIIQDLEIKKQNANKLQSSFRLLKDIAITQNNKIYAKECEKLELFAYEIYLKAERDIKSKELRKFLDDEDNFKQKTTNKPENISMPMWKVTLEHSLLKFYEITSEHHTNFARIINFTLAIVFSLYLELSIVKIFSFFNTGFFNHILTNFFSSYHLGVYFGISLLLIWLIYKIENPVGKFIVFIFMIFNIVLFIFPDYLILIYFGILFIILMVFYINKNFVYYFISLFAIVCFICFPIFSKNIITSPSIYYLDNTLNTYIQEDIRKALKIASVENQEKFNKTKKDSEPKEESKPSQNIINLKTTISQNEVSSNITINQMQEPYDLYFGTNVVNLSVKNAQNIQDIKQFIKDNKLLMYYTSVKSSNEIYNNIIKAIWIDLQLDTIYFIFFIIMILCIYSMQKTFRKNTI